MIKPFQGIAEANQVVTPSGTSASVTIQKGTESIRFINPGSGTCHVRIGKGSQTATTSDTPILSSSMLVLNKDLEDDTVAYISSSGTTLHIQPGAGSGLNRGASPIKVPWENQVYVTWENLTTYNWENWGK